MSKLSAISLERLATCDTRIQDVVRAAAVRFNFIVLCGHRGKEDQEKAFAEGNSRLHFPHSKHNASPSHAVDLAPFPIDWHDVHRFDDLAKVMLEEAARLQVPMEWGGTAFKGFVDKPHFQLKDQ